MNSNLNELLLTKKLNVYEIFLNEDICYLGICVSVRCVSLGMLYNTTLLRILITFHSKVEHGAVSERQSGSKIQFLIP
jgi:hypothetical protein